MINPRGDPVEILMVDDCLGDVDLTREALEAAKMRNHLTAARDGEEALAILKRQGAHTAAPRPDLILLDLNMPRKNGFEVLEAIKADEDLKAIPVVILTSSQAEQDIVKGYQLHANAYVVKPVGLEAFMTVVKSIEGFWLEIVKLPPNHNTEPGAAPRE
jgi:two-component system, chemotaxis family, response regulator Rcp1